MNTITKIIKSLFKKKVSTRSFIRPARGHSGSKYIITIETTYSDGSVEKRGYIGRCTVWHTFPGFRPCSTALEYQLYNIYQKHINSLSE